MMAKQRGRYADNVVLGRYSNHADQEGDRIDRVLTSVPPAPSSPVYRPTMHMRRWLVPDKIEELVEAYQAGSTLNQLGDRFPSTHIALASRRSWNYEGYLGGTG